MWTITVPKTPKEEREELERLVEAQMAEDAREMEEIENEPVYDSLFNRTFANRAERDEWYSWHD